MPIREVIMEKSACIRKEERIYWQIYLYMGSKSVHKNPENQRKELYAT